MSNTKRSRTQTHGSINRAYPTSLPLALLAWMTCYSIGCSGYAMQGRVVRGPFASVQIVAADDTRYTETNSTGSRASVLAILEPETPTERVDLGRHLTDEQGYFKIPVDTLGAGFLEYEVQVLARRMGNQPALETIDLPGPSKRVLITLPLGVDNDKATGSYLDKVLEEAAPYLEENR